MVKLMLQRNIDGQIRLLGVISLVEYVTKEH